MGAHILSSGQDCPLLSAPRRASRAANVGKESKSWLGVEEVFGSCLRWGNVALAFWWGLYQGWRRCEGQPEVAASLKTIQILGLAEAISHRLLTATARVRCRVVWDLWWTMWQCVMFLPSTSVAPVSPNSARFSTLIIIIRDWYNRPVVADVPSGLTVTPPQENYYKRPVVILVSRGICTGCFTIKDHQARIRSVESRSCLVQSRPKSCLSVCLSVCLSI
jgi:hypothetical protein